MTRSLTLFLLFSPPNLLAFLFLVPLFRLLSLIIFFVLRFIFIIRNFFLVLGGYRVEDLLNIRFFLEFLIVINIFIITNNFRSYLILKILLTIKSDVAIRHNFEIEHILSLFFLSIVDFKCFCELVKLEIFMVHYREGFTVTHYQMPTFLFQVRVAYCTAEIAQSICLTTHNESEKVLSSDICLILDFKITINLNARKIFKTLSNVD